MNNFKALFLNCSLKTGEDVSNTQALMDEVSSILTSHRIECETVRMADYHVPYGVTYDEGGGDQWPEILAKISDANIVVVGTPLWMGEQSSIAKKLMERIFGSGELTNESGQSIFYNKVGGVVVTGNEDGAKNAAASLIFGLNYMGFTMPPSPVTYWTGEAGPGPSFIEEEGIKNEFTAGQVKTMGYNLLHMARILENNAIPAEGNQKA
ncbi:flavodoxin family protein [Natribacillus halophilus]|uniref:Multimeric flavodoxin WrbA n=1 Tax=Natribacillus halophilus TaxID=549003 RepID=A0A1G8RM68_9BACI|nr:flavodoxin family protein [Natribacillus halophilus]SDJ18098.1 Multimeric flavodoxin WrbA [Natribacillus halophilus]